MAPTVQTRAPNHPRKETPMSSTRRTALVAGVFYLITFISIPTLVLYGPVKNHRDWIISSGTSTAVLVGGFLEVIVALAGIGTAVTLVTLRQDLGGAAGADAASLVTAGASHVAIYNWTFLLGQSLMPGINALLLGSLMYRSRLVPRLIPVMGLIGAPLLIISVFATLFAQHSTLTGLAALPVIPVAAWELSLGVWLVVKGFRPTPITTEMAAVTSPAAHQDVAV